MTGRQQEGSVILAPLKSPSDWDAACATFPSATAFHHYDFLETVAPPLNCSFVPLVIFSPGRAGRPGPAIGEEARPVLHY